MKTYYAFLILCLGIRINSGVTGKNPISHATFHCSSLYCEPTNTAADNPVANLITGIPENDPANIPGEYYLSSGNMGHDMDQLPPEFNCSFERNGSDNGASVKGYPALKAGVNPALYICVDSITDNYSPIENCRSNTPETRVGFETTDTKLQRLFDTAEKISTQNISDFSGYKVLVEGGGYKYVWLETQAMGGVMYAKRDISIARNNVEIFIDFQRNDDRMPGMITHDDRYFPGSVKSDTSAISPVYGWFQGYFFPMPAYELYFWLNKDKTYLQKLYGALEKMDAYLWHVRDSDNDGCLESWCVFDTGEDYSTRYGESPNSWPFEVPPTREFIMSLSESEKEVSFFGKKDFDFDQFFPVPMESMDFMSYSYTGRDVLAQISRELGNDKEQYWREKADAVKSKIKEYLWDSEKYACFDRDKDNQVIDILTHNNLRCMYFGSFDQQMADEFIKYHLGNPLELVGIESEVHQSEIHVEGKKHSLHVKPNHVYDFSEGLQVSRSVDFFQPGVKYGD